MDKKAPNAQVLRRALVEMGFDEIRAGPTGNPCLGEVMRQIMQEHGGSARKFAKRSGLHPSTVGKIVSADRNISVHSLYMLTKVIPAKEIVRLVQASQEPCTEVKGALDE